MHAAAAVARVRVVRVGVCAASVKVSGSRSRPLRAPVDSQIFGQCHRGEGLPIVQHMTSMETHSSRKADDGRLPCIRPWARLQTLVIPLSLQHAVCTCCTSHDRGSDLLDEDGKSSCVQQSLRKFRRSDCSVTSQHLGSTSHGRTAGPIRSHAFRTAQAHSLGRRPDLRDPKSGDAGPNRDGVGAPEVSSMIVST
jgi:hypothetical protein